MTLKDRCHEAGTTLRGLADALGVHNSIVSLWEKGRRPIPEARLEAVCEALGCKPADLGCRVGVKLADDTMIVVDYQRPPEPFAYRAVVWFAQQTCLMCGTPVDARLRCPRCRRAVA